MDYNQLLAKHGVAPNLPSPRDYGVPHDKWRPHQLETVEWLEAQAGFLVVEAPTGSGKTSYASALAKDEKVVSLVATKNLQAENYGNSYGWDVLFGRGNYPCAYIQGATAAECAFSNEMNNCPVADSCEYSTAKTIAKGSSRLSLNYSYWMTALWPRANPPDSLVMDECHELPDITISFAGTTVTQKEQIDWRLPVFPQINNQVQLTTEDSPIPVALKWLSSAIATLSSTFKSLSNDDSAAARKKADKCEHLMRKLQATKESLEDSPLDWYIKSGRTARDAYGKKLPGFICKPLTARHHFGRWFDIETTRTVLMSATVGKFDVFAEELGIESYQARLVPNQWPPATRSIYIPSNVPKMGNKSPDSAYDLQAKLIADSIKSMPRSWSGLCLVTRKSEAYLVAKRLAKHGLGDRVWVPPEKGTDIVAKEWAHRKKQAVRRKQNAPIMVSWQHWQGFDGLDEKLLFILKTPFPFLGDEYERVRMRYSNGYYMLRTAQMLQQGVGRTRRGRREDYDVDGETNGLVSVMDGNWTRVRNYLSQDFLEAVVS